jgi:hypothetical protein
MSDTQGIREIIDEGRNGYALALWRAGRTPIQIAFAGVQFDMRLRCEVDMMLRRRARQPARGSEPKGERP